MANVTLIDREGAEATKAEEAAWLVVGDVTLTVRQPSRHVELLQREGGDPHPDDTTYDWPNLPPGLMRPSPVKNILYRVEALLIDEGYATTVERLPGRTESWAIGAERDGKDAQRFSITVGETE